MDDYIQGNKAAWEEAFSLRDPAWGSDIEERIGRGEPYAYFTAEMADVLKKYDLAGKSVGQFCCNNGRELLSLARTAGLAEGVGFDIAENQVAFANETARKLALPCEFRAVNILDIGDEYREKFDAMLLTIGALCWFKDLNRFFAVAAKCMKPGAVILIHESHPASNMLANDEDEEFDPEHPLQCAFSYFDHEWISSGGMTYITGKPYASKTFTDYTHPLSEIVTALCENGMVVTGMREFDVDISANFDGLSGRGFPLSMILEGEKRRGETISR